MAFVAGDNVHFIAFHLTFQNERLLLIGNTLAELLGHLVSLGDRQIQFGGDLLIRQIQPPEIRAQHPNSQWLMMPSKNSTREIIKTTITIAAAISLAANFVRVVSVLDDMFALAVRTTNTLRPS